MEVGQSRLKEQFDDVWRTKVQRMLGEPQGPFFFPFLFLADYMTEKVER